VIRRHAFGQQDRLSELVGGKKRVVSNKISAAQAVAESPLDAEIAEQEVQVFG
jgi:hypothetical protein